MGMKRRAGGNVGRDPFLFVGHGFGTSARCLELYLWFAEPPNQSDRRWIAEQLPSPVASFVRFDGPLLHAGSDDDFEAQVVAAYRPAAQGSEPRPREWKAFCSDFERAVRKIHERAPLFAVVKPDDGAYGKKLSPWHRRSLARAAELAELANTHRTGQNDAWSALARNLREEVADADAPAPKPGRTQSEPGLSPAQLRARTNGKQLLRAAVQEIVIPHLRKQGFAGSLGTIRKIDKRTHLLWFEFSSGEYGKITVGMSKLAPRTDTSAKQDYDRAHGPRDYRHRKYLSDAASAAEQRLFWYEDAAAIWGDEWPPRLAELLLQLLQSKKAQRWLGLDWQEISACL